MLTAVKLLDDVGLYFGPLHVPPPKRSDSQFRTVISQYVQHSLKAGQQGSITGKDLGEARVVRDFCDWIRKESGISAYGPGELLADLPRASVDILDLAKALAELDIFRIGVLLAGVDDLFGVIALNVAQKQYPEIAKHFKRLVSPVLAMTGAEDGSLDTPWLSALRASYDRAVGNESTDVALERTRQILAGPSTDHRQQFRALWGELFDANELRALDRSLEATSATDYGKTPQWAIGAANCRFAQGIHDESTYYLNLARDRFEAEGLDDPGRIALAHLAARLALQKYERAESVELQRHYLDEAIDQTSIDAPSPHLQLLLANTQVRRAFHCCDKAVPIEEWQPLDNVQRIQKLTETADGLFQQLEGSSQRNKALVGRCYLHHLGSALNFGMQHDLRRPLLRDLREYLDGPKGRFDYAAIASAAYCAALAEDPASAEKELRRADIAHLSDRHDHNVMWCCLLGYFFSTKSTRRFVFRRTLVRMLRDKQIRITYNVAPLVAKGLVPEPHALHLALLQACRWGLGTEPLIDFGDDFIKFVGKGQIGTYGAQDFAGTQ